MRSTIILIVYLASISSSCATKSPMQVCQEIHKSMSKDFHSCVANQMRIHEYNMRVAEHNARVTRQAIGVWNSMERTRHADEQWYAREYDRFENEGSGQNACVMNWDGSMQCP